MGSGARRVACGFIACHPNPAPNATPRRTQQRQRLSSHPGPIRHPSTHTWEEKPHWGASGTPFMYTTTGWLATVSAIIAWTSSTAPSSSLASAAKVRTLARAARLALRTVTAVACKHSKKNMGVDKGNYFEKRRRGRPRRRRKAKKKKKKKKKNSSGRSYPRNRIATGFGSYSPQGKRLTPTDRRAAVEKESAILNESWGRSSRRINQNRTK